MSSAKKRKKKNNNPGFIYIAVLFLVLLVIVGGVVAAIKYAPTSEKMELTEYFKLKESNETAVIMNGEYLEVADGDNIYAVCEDGQVYLEINFVKDKLDDSYVYDSVENVLRYATDVDVYSTTLGTKEYTINKSTEALGHNTMVSQGGTVFVATDYLQLLTDFQCRHLADPNRIIIETAGWEKKVSSLKKKTDVRRFGGNKSLILEEGTKGESVIILEDYGKWSLVLTDNGVLGCVKNQVLADAVTETVEAKIADRAYNHMKFSGKISLGWHQVTAKAANDSIANVLSETGKINVIAPTWFFFKNNQGGIIDIGSKSYVDYCHQNGVQVWGVVNNFDGDGEFDTATVLNTTSSRDTLVNNLIAAAIQYGLDGINVDIEQLPGKAADGYIQFIKELSIKCENNDIFLSTDNYVPDASNACYNRRMQANYCDYVVIMAYDEHYAGGDEAGSVASIDFVEEGLKATLLEVPSEQTVLGVPFYCRVWEEAGDGSISSSAYGLGKIQSFIKNNNATVTWDDVEGQYYAEFVKGDVTYRIWVEDDESIELKLKLLEKYGIAGAAYWKLGMDNSSVWNIIAKYL